MRLTLALSVVLTLTTCSLVVRDRLPAVEVRCAGREVDCPSSGEVQAVLDVFAAEVPHFDPRRPLVVRWVPEGGLIGRTWGPGEVEITSISALPHELMHVHFWRLANEPDANHEEPPGPWTAASTEATRRVRNDLGI